MIVKAINDVTPRVYPQRRHGGVPMTEEHKLTRGLVQVYTGNGKGKTTASLGLVFRALGHGLRIYVMQFMKGQTVYGELESAKRFSDQLTIEQVGRPRFVKQGKQTLVDRQMAQEAFARARVLVSSGNYDLVVLDELNCAVDFELVELEAVKEMIRSKPEHTELVITGRNVHPEIVELADLVTEMREIKHYYHAGQQARVGIES
jgi:cob(I)alamin adenosyltransferase